MDDNELRARLQAADRARDDAPATSWIDELVEATMTTAQEQRTEETTKRPRWVVPAAAAAAVAGIAAVGALAFTGGGDDPADEPTTTQLALPDANAAMQMCVAIDAQVLSTVPVAFDGTIDTTELVIGLNFGEPGFAVEPKPIEPLATIPEACDPDTGECQIGFDGLPEVELFDVEAGTWRRLPHLEGGSRYTVSGPKRFVDPSTGTVLVRFVNDDSDGVGFSLDLAITGSLR